MATSKEYELARAFAAVITDWLTPDELAAANDENKFNGFADATCATHNHCDANEAMLDAMASLGMEYDPADQQQTDMINKAWLIAKASGFDPSAILDTPQTQHGG